MYLCLQAPAHSNLKNTSYNTIVKDNNFRALTIDKDSYIVSAIAQCSIDFEPDPTENGILYNLQVGKNSALAEEIIFMIAQSKDYNSLHMSYITELNIFREKNNIPDPLSRSKTKGQILIGNDCWVGRGATIMGGVTIHSGAVVACNSLVTKDVPPYAVVGGNPAKIIKYRFPQDVIDKLLKIAWWNWSSETIAIRHEDFTIDPALFAEKYYREAEEKIQNILDQPCLIEKTQGENFLYAPDLDEVYSNHKRVIKEFCGKFNNSDNMLVIAVKNSEEAELLMNDLDIYSDYNVNIYIHVYDDQKELLPIAANMDTYITSRHPYNLEIVEWCFNINKKCISGVDAPIF